MTTLILDRDGTVIAEKHYLSRPEQVELLPGAARGLWRLQRAGFRIVLVTNQSGLGRGLFSQSDLQAVHGRMFELLSAARVRVDGIYWCPHEPRAACACRKPGTELAQRAARELGFDASDAIVVGDKECDLELGRRLGATSVLVRTGYGRETERRAAVVPDLVVADLNELADRLAAEVMQ